MNIGDIVVVINTDSLPVDFVGRYGKVTEVNEHKLTIEFAQSVGTTGSLSHTAYPSDLIKVGESVGG